MRLVSSDLALLEVLALSAAESLSLAELARAVDTTPSAAQRALEILADDEIVIRDGTGSRPRYRLSTTPVAQHVLDLARLESDSHQAFIIGARANPAIEFVGSSDEEYLVVFAKPSQAMAQARAARFVEAIAGLTSHKIRYLDHADVRRQVLDDPALRIRASEMRILYGSLDRTFPDRSQHGVRRGDPLGRPHSSLELPPRHAIEVLRRRYGLASMKLFGSAVRSDFRPDSDVDLLVRFQPGVRRSVASLASLEADLQRLFERDVHVIGEESVGSDALPHIQREAVSIL